MTSLKAGERAYIANAVKKKDRIEGQRSRVAITEFTVVRVTEKGVWLQQEGHPKPKYITMASNLAHATKTAALNALIGAEHRKWAVLANMQQEHIRTMEDARLLIEYEGVKHRRSERFLYEMLQQRVGTSCLDSGGTPRYDANGRYVGSDHGYGRHSERNQGRDFASEPAATVSFSVYESRAGVSRVEINLSLSTFHFLRDRCELAEDLDTLLHGKFLSECDPDDNKCWLELMEMFPEYITEQLDEDGVPIYGEEVGGIYGDRAMLSPINTYNHSSLVDQTLQYKYFTLDGAEYVILQVHQEADVRGSYGTCHCFKLTNELAIFDDQRATIFCTGENHHPEALRLKNRQESQTCIDGVELDSVDLDGCHDHHWTTDDGGSHWYLESTCGKGYRQLETHEVHDLDEECAEDAEPFVWTPGILCVQEGKGYCPICGGLLAAGSM